MLKRKELDDYLPGFDVPDEGENEPKEVLSGKKKKKGSGGFQTMGFSFPILKGITKRGYKQPTPIQRKTIPLALEGKDVVAMARTGSGKTACFVLPILEKLVSPNHKATPGKNFRALILSPTRELALQTLRFVRELGKFSGLTAAAILGGESIEHQFGTMSGTAPDIVVATPGRFLHICIEMSLKLDNIKVVVFDEADRLFELGFGEQLRDIVGRLPSARQSLLFSATLPKSLVEFARAGAALADPALVRLDVDWQLPPALWLGWLAVRAELKTAALLLLLDRVLTQETPQAVVFAATKHHVEYLNMVLERAGVASACAYSGLASSARKIALARFVQRRVAVLCVTDVAARGLDLPALDTVVNYNFPATPKLFVHRVGRSARAGRGGRAFSLVSAEEVPHLLDLHLFLGAELRGPGEGAGAGAACPSGVWGAVPGAALELRHQDVVRWERTHADIGEAARVCARGWQQYVRWRAPASPAAHARAKLLPPPAASHPYLQEAGCAGDGAHRDLLLRRIHDYTPKGTILELSAKSDSPMYTAMKLKKLKHGSLVQKVRDHKKAQADVTSQQNDVESPTGGGPAGGAGRAGGVRDQNYIPHTATDEHTEMGLAVQLELAPDSGDAQRARTAHLTWDRKRKKMVHVDPDGAGGRKMIRTESGARLPATYRSGRYALWLQRGGAGAGGGDNGGGAGTGKTVSEFRPQWARHNEREARRAAGGRGGPAGGMKDKQQIVKERMRKEKIKAKLKHKTKNKKKKRK